MPLSSLIGNERIKKWLRRGVSEGRIGQSLLMAGPRGVGKCQFAIALAQALNCERPDAGDACGGCIQCRKIERLEHADLRVFLRESQDPSVKKDSPSRFIKVEQMRELAEQAQYRPYEGRRRVFIVDGAEWLRHEAANAMLKTLEEPPGTSLIVLITSKPYALLDTIRSRCLMLSFAPLTAEEIEAHLRATGKPEADLHLLARLARGSIGHALEIDLAAYREKRDRMLEVIELLAFRGDTSSLLSASEYLGRRLDRDAFEDHLDTMLVLLSDLFHLKLDDSDSAITNTDIAERLEAAASQVSIDDVTQWVDRIEQLLRALPRNINRQMATDALLVT